MEETELGQHREVQGWAATGQLREGRSLRTMVHDPMGEHHRIPGHRERCVPGVLLGWEECSSSPHPAEQ